MRAQLRFNRRSEALLFFAALDFVYAYSLLVPLQPVNEQQQWMATKLPLWVWGGLWLIVGVLCLVFAFLIWDTIAFTAAVAIKVCWAILSLFGWIDGAVPLGYVSAVIWLVFAWFVFRVAGGIPPPARPIWRRR